MFPAPLVEIVFIVSILPAAKMSLTCVLGVRVFTVLSRGLRLLRKEPK